MRYAAVTLLIAVLTASAVRAQSPGPTRAGGERNPLYVSGGSVDFTVPESWSPIRDQHMSVVGLFQKTVLYPAGGGEEPGEERKVVARITLAATDLGSLEEDFRSLKEMVARRPPKYLNFVTLSDVFHGDNWRTLVTKGTTHGEPYVSLMRSALVGRQTVNLSVTLLTDGRDPEPFRQAVADFNAVCESLKIDGKNQLDTKLNADRILELLGAGAKK